MTFTELGLAAPILKALEAEGYTTPTPIQAQAIPTVLAGSDLLGIAQTGTGKTAAFALPILHRLATDRRPRPRKGCRALVLSPTRELASQIADSFRTYGKHLELSVATIFGGVAHRPQIERLSRGIDVLVATPGRLLDHVAERNAVLQSTEVFVLDEADQMLDLGFVKPIRRIVGQLPARRQNLFFSATMPREIAQLADELLHEPVKVAVTPVSSTVDRVAQRVIHVESRKKRSLLTELFADAQMARTLVFTRTKRGADRVAQHLETQGIQAAAIHGNKSQRQREEALAALRSSRIRALVATDIAARGIDIEQVTHVVNFELPEVPESYVHRIGRTGRAGATGLAISLCDGAERGLLRDIERLTRQSIPSEDRRNDAGLEADNSGRPAGGGHHPNGRPAQTEHHGHRSGERHREAQEGRRTADGQGHQGDRRGDGKRPAEHAPRRHGPPRGPAGPRSANGQAASAPGHRHSERRADGRPTERAGDERHQGAQEGRRRTADGQGHQGDRPGDGKRPVRHAPHRHGPPRGPAGSRSANGPAAPASGHRHAERKADGRPTERAGGEGQTKRGNNWRPRADGAHPKRHGQSPANRYSRKSGGPQ